MRTRRTAQDELRLIEGLLADAALDKALLRLRRVALHQKDWATQPRAPAGQSDVRDGDTGEVLSRTTFTPTELVSEPTVQSTFAPAVPFAIAAGIEAIQAARTIELALSLFTVLSARKDGFGTVLGLTAHGYTPGDLTSVRMTAWVGQLNQQQLDSACPRNGEVRAITNDVTRTVRASGQYRNKTDFGNKVHFGIANVVSQRRDPNFRAELLLDPAGKVPKVTEGGNVRFDMLENVVATRILCVYDYKTG